MTSTNPDPQASFKTAADVLRKARDTALVAEIFKVLEENGVIVPEDLEHKCFEAARNFDNTNLGQTIQDKIKATQGPSQQP